MQSNERWPTCQSLNSGENKNSCDNFVDSVELHLELGSMNATAVVLIAFGLFAEFASIAKTDQYTIKNEYLYTINGHKPTSKWPRRALRIIGALAPSIINLNNIVSTERLSWKFDSSAFTTLGLREPSRVSFLLACQGFRLHSGRKWQFSLWFCILASNMQPMRLNRCYVTIGQRPYEVRLFNLL